MSKADIEAAEQRWLQAFNGGDASGTAQLYRTDGRVLPPNLPIQEGRAAIEGLLKEFISMGAQLSFDLLKVHETPDLCVSVGRYRMSLTPPGAPAQQDEGKFVEVWTREPDGSWLIADDIFNSSLPAPA